MKKIIYFAASALLAAGCADNGTTESGLVPENFVSDRDGKQTALYTLTNRSGMEVCITNFGGRIVSVYVPGKDGVYRDVVEGFDNIGDYMTVPSDFGAAIGRYANRIDHGRIVIDGEEYRLPQNNFGHCLHGGPEGWQYKVYDVVKADDTSLELSIVSPDGDSGFPGTLTATVRYTLTDDNAIRIDYSATTDKPTVINMTNHSYFNLSGNPARPVTDDILYINASRYTPVDSTFMTTGEILPVEGTPMDFTEPKAIGRDIDADFQQLKNGKGYDHNWVLDTEGSLDKVAASVYSPESGIMLEVYTDEPGIQVYTGNFLDGTVVGKKGIAYGFRTAVCLETQHFPDSPNKPQWPSAVLRPGDEYTGTCIYRFSVKK